MGRGRRRRAHPRRRPTGSGKTLAAFLSALDRLAAAARARRPDAPLPGALRQPAQGAGRRRRAQPARPAGRHPAGQRPPGPAPARHHRRHALGRHPGRRAPPVRPAPGRHPHHHPRVAVPAADLGRARIAARRRHGDRRRGARGVLDQARGPPGRLARPARRAARASGPAHRPVGHRPSRRRGGHLPGRRPAGHRRPAAVAEVRRAAGRRAGRGHVGDRRADRRPHRCRRGRPAPGVDLAARRGTGARPRPGPPLDDRVRQLPPAGRAAHGPAERARRRAGRARARRPGRTAGRR